MVELSAEAHGVMRVMLILHPRVAAIGTHILRELLWTIAMATLQRQCWYVECPQMAPAVRFDATS